MARRASGWSIVWKSGIAHVRFTLGGKRVSVTTGERDSGRAAQVAARIYADTVNGLSTGRVTPSSAERRLDVAVAGWLASIDGVLDPSTYKTYHGYSLRWLGRWSSVDEVHDSAIAAFVRDRLRSVLAKTVRKELAALNGMLSWAVEAGMLASKPAIPEISGKLTGRRAQRRAKSTIVAKDTLLAAIDQLPEWSKPRHGRQFPIRARLIFQYETGLRREGVDALEWSDVNGSVLTLRDEVDKARFGRELPLSEAAVEALASIRGSLPSHQKADPLIFGAHDYRSALRPLARSLGLETVHLRQLRHNRGTHLADEGVPLTAIAYLLGHKHISTTAIYARGTQAAAFEAIHGTKAKAPAGGG